MLLLGFILVPSFESMLSSLDLFNVEFATAKCDKSFLSKDVDKLLVVHGASRSV